LGHLTRKIVSEKTYNVSSGTLLFITYINELADLLSDYNVIVKLFADDLKLYAEISTDIETTHFNGALQCINDWANALQLQISIAKCCVLQLNKKCLENLRGPFSSMEHPYQPATVSETLVLLSTSLFLLPHILQK